MFCHCHVSAPLVCEGGEGREQGWMCMQASLLETLSEIVFTINNVVQQPLKAMICSQNGWLAASPHPHHPQSLSSLRSHHRIIEPQHPSPLPQHEATAEMDSGDPGMLNGSRGAILSTAGF